MNEGDPARTNPPAGMAAAQPNTTKIPIRALIMKGGGVKGLAFAGAIQELERYYEFESYVGTSAGAIAAVLLACGYTGAEMEEILSRKEFREFLDGGLLAMPFNLLLKGGLHPGAHLRQWLRDLIGRKIPRADRYPLHALQKRAVLFACSWPTTTLVFDSHRENRDVDADFAVRCSMSIPIFFIPQWHGDDRVLDGGLLHNFPIQTFKEREPGATFIGLYLGSRAAPARVRGGQLSDIFNILLGRDERSLIQEHREKTVCIDCDPIHTVDFKLNGQDKVHLLAQGRAAALKFLRDQALPGGPSEAEVRAATEHAENARRVVQRRRRVRRAVRRSFSFAAVAAAVLLTFGIPQNRRAFLRATRNACPAVLCRPSERTPAPIAIVLNDNVPYVNAILASLRSELEKNLHNTKYEPVFAIKTGRPEATADADAANVKALRSSLENSRVHGDSAPPLLVTIGTGATVSAFKHFSHQPLLFAGVTDPVCSGILAQTRYPPATSDMVGCAGSPRLVAAPLEKRPIAGVKYMPPTREWLDLLLRIFPGKRLSFVYDGNYAQDECLAREIRELAKEGRYGQTSVMRVDPAVTDITDCSRTDVFFGWYWLDLQLDKHAEFRACAPVVTSTADLAKRGRAPIAISVEDAEIGRLAAHAIEQYLVDGTAMQEMPTLWPSFRVYVRKSEAQKHHIRIPWRVRLTVAGWF
jgi:predicted acylesterase/phospholipase RssA/ABC-type uncharacterized transport system substrate-binding protein